MSDHATPNLPSRNFAATVLFYSALGFKERWHDANWLILNRGDAVLEFFPFPDLDPLKSSFGCCLRLDDLDAFFDVCKATGMTENPQVQPRLQVPKVDYWGGRVGALIDLDGTLARLIQNEVGLT